MSIAEPSTGAEIADILLAEYASGCLDEVCSVLVSAYITLNPLARRTVSDYETLGGAMMENLCEPVSMAKGSLEKVLGRLDSAEKPKEACSQDQETQVCRFYRAMPRPLQRYVREKCGSLKWRNIYPGIAICPIPVDGGRYQTWLVSAQPGAKLPHHEHIGNEMTLVMTGKYSDAHGAYKAGDLVPAVAGTTHAPVADKEEGCFCLVVAEGSVRFTRGFLRFLNPFIR